MLDATFESMQGGRRLRVARLGSGPPLVLLHGYPDNLQIWSAVAPSLADRFEVIAFDWPGMGYSDAWPGGASPFQMANRLLALLDLWGIRRATLAGIDMGGQPALVFAALHPERTAGLVVINSLVLWDEVTSWEIALLRRFQLNRLIIRHFPRIVFYRAERTFLPPGVSLPPELRNDLWGCFQRVEVRKFISRMCAGYQATLPRLPELYSRISCPTLILWGENDQHFPPAHGERLHRAISGSQLTIVPRAEHWMVWYLAGEVASAIRAFQS
ncbi:MAG TPA: alpha/beta hydrolase [Burkholderiales bacterium]|nr:alpha/beta hydrolase [Burkholderiales bacterium]